MSSKFLFIRHCESTWNPTIVGFHDGDLTSNGKAQADKILLTLPITHIYSSSLLRARTTAIIINDKYNLPLTIHSDLEEYRYHQNETEEAFRARIVPFIQSLIESDNNFVVVSHAKVFKILVSSLCGSSLEIDYGMAYEFTFDGQWNCRLK